VNRKLLSLLTIILLAGVLVFTIWKNIDVTDQSSNGKSTIVPGTTPDETPEAIVGELAPDFELQTLDGHSMKLSDLQGKKVILNFWASWCDPCKEEMPDMQKFYQSHKNDGIEVIAVNLTNQDNGMDDIKAFVKDYGLTFTIPLDKDGMVSIIYQAFGIPTSYIIDSKGIIREKVIGPMDLEKMESLTANID